MLGQVVPEDAVHEETTHRLQHRREEGYGHAEVHPQPGNCFSFEREYIQILTDKTSQQAFIYVKYIKYSVQVMSLSPAPLSLLIKAAPILTDDMYGDVQPAAWELLLSVDEHMAAAAGESAVSDLWMF